MTEEPSWRHRHVSTEIVHQIFESLATSRSRHLEKVLQSIYCASYANLISTLVRGN